MRDERLTGYAFMNIHLDLIKELDSLNIVNKLAKKGKWMNLIL